LAFSFLLPSLDVFGANLSSPLPSPAAANAETYFFSLKWGTQGSGDGQFKQPCGVSVDGFGNVYVADSGNDRVQKFSSSGVYLAKWGSSGSSGDQFNYPPHSNPEPRGSFEDFENQTG
jgi:DNA-binding beta-propeller fold protein YncE